MNMKWFERKLRVTYLVNVGVEAETIEQANVLFDQEEFDDFDIMETLKLEYLSKTEEFE